MTDSPIGMGKQDQAEREKFENELKRILKASDEAGILLRVIGSLAFKCTAHNTVTCKPRWDAHTPIDFGAHSRQARQVSDLMAGMGYVENLEVFSGSEGERAIFDKLGTGLHVDIFYEKLDFCHPIYWKARLEVDSPTIPLTELLLEKMQIVQINEKDIIVTIMLLLEHPLGDSDKETINIKLAAELCANDWGLWRTTTMNLNKVKQLAHHYTQLTAEQKSKIESQVVDTLARMDKLPKRMAWRLRDRVGDRVKWYKDVDEV